MFHCEWFRFFIANAPIELGLKAITMDSGFATVKAIPRFSIRDEIKDFKQFVSS